MIRCQGNLVTKRFKKSKIKKVKKVVDKSESI